MNAIEELRTKSKEIECEILYKDDYYEVYKDYCNKVRITETFKQELIDGKWNDKPLPKIPNTVKGFMNPVQDLSLNELVDSLDFLFEFVGYNTSNIERLDLSKSGFFKEVSVIGLFNGLYNIKEIILPSGSFTHFRSMLMVCTPTVTITPHNSVFIDYITKKEIPIDKAMKIIKG